MPRRALSLAYFFVSCLGHGAALLLVAREQYALTYPAEVAVLVALCWTTSLVSLLLNDFVPFFFVHLLRLAFLICACFLLGSGPTYVPTLVAVPFVLESMLYVELKLAITFSVAAIAGGTLGRFDEQSLTQVCLLLIVAILAGLVTIYRQQLVAGAQRIRELKLSLISLESANRAYQDYAEKIESDSQETERNRITREIHDTIGYALTNISMLLQAAQKVAPVDVERGVSLLDDAREQTNSALQESRKILHKLRSVRKPVSEGLPAIAHLARSLQEATGIDVQVAFGNVARGFGDTVDKAVFRLVQEGITNAIRHGNATKIRIGFWITESELQVRVWDNGSGSDNPVEGIGLAGMRERFSAFGGRVEAGRDVDGFALCAYIPIGELMHEDP